MAKASLHPTLNAAAVVAQRVIYNRDLIDFGPSSIAVALQLASDLASEIDNADCSEYATPRNIGALIDCARGLALHLGDAFESILEPLDREGATV